MTRIVEIRDIVCQGMTEPVICRAEDGFDYVVKGSYAGRRSLIAEWVAGRLGRLLGLPIPEFCQLQLDPRLVLYGAKTVEIERLGRGILFGSRRESGLVEIRQADIALIDWELRARVLAFDWWIENSDRVLVDGAGNPNLLWSEEGSRLVVMDHNLAFDPSSMEGFGKEHAFRHACLLWNEPFRSQMELAFRGALTELPIIWSEIPQDWTEIECGLTLSGIESSLWRFHREADKFWNWS
jgi:hypothetical protein